MKKLILSLVKLWNYAIAYKEIIVTFTNIRIFIFSIVSRMFSFVAMMKLTMIDFVSYQRKKVSYLGLSILLHAILNGMLYAYELQVIKVIAHFDIWFMLVYSIAVIVISSIICRKELTGRAVLESN